MVRDYCTGIQHIGVPTDDIEKTRDFYNSLGFETVKECRNGDALFLFMKMSNLIIEIYLSDGVSKLSGAIDHIAIDVTDIEGCFSLMKKMNYTFMEEKISDLPFWEKGIRYFIIVGYNGEKIEFSQILK